MKKKRKDNLHCNKVKCSTCIFHEGQDVVTPERLAEIQKYLIEGTTHLCHKTNLVCRGGRDYQLEIYHRLGYISEPTDQALEEAMISTGVREKGST